MRSDCYHWSPSGKSLDLQFYLLIYHELASYKKDEPLRVVEEGGADTLIRPRSQNSRS